MEPRFSETFDVYIERAGIWTLECMTRTPGDAHREAEALLRKADVTGMRLMRCRTSLASGSVTEDLLVERTRAARPKEPAVGAISDAPDCTTVDDLLRPRARYCIHRLFHDWIETHDVGVLECMMTPRLFDQLLDRGSLVEKAVQRVAALQVADGADAKTRVDALLALIDDVRRHARSLEGIVLPPAEALEATVAQDTIGPADAALARDVAKNRTRFTKMMQVVALLDNVRNPLGVGVLDRWLSDYMMDPEVSGDLAGEQIHRADRLDWIARTALGQGDPDDPQQSRLAELIATGLLGQTRDAMLLSLDHALSQPAMLMDGTPAAERTAVVRLARLCARAFPDFLGGPRLAARLTDRYASLQHGSGPQGFAEAMETITVDMDTCGEQLSYLLALLSGSEVGSVKRRLLRQIDDVMRLYGGLERHYDALTTPHGIAEATEVLRRLVRHAAPGPKTEAAWIGAIQTAAADRLTALGH